MCINRVYDEVGFCDQGLRSQDERERRGGNQWQITCAQLAHCTVWLLYSKEGQDDAAKWWMDSKIIFIDFEEPSMEDKEEEEDTGACECAEAEMCVTGPIQYPQTQAFCPCPHISDTPGLHAFHLHYCLDG